MPSNGTGRRSDPSAGLVSTGQMLVFFDRIPDTFHHELTSRMIGEDWKAFGFNGTPAYPGIKRFDFNSVGRLHRALELLCVGMGHEELNLVRVSLVPDGVAEHNTLVEAAHGMEYLGQMLERVRAGWLYDLLARREQFFNVFQPLVDVGTGQVYAYEMLIRAHADSRGGVIGGGQLAEAALASNQIYTFDSIARELAIETTAKKLHSDTRVFINFMPNSVFGAEESLEKTTQHCDTFGITPDRVVFEIIESESIADVGSLKRLLDGYRARGFKVALDDLGSGYSGLNYMLELMPDFVKIDMEMVRGIADNRAKQVIVSKITEAAHFMGIKVIAEGVEYCNDFTAVREIGVDYVQGFLFAKPSHEKVYERDFNLIDHALKAVVKV